MSAYIDKKFINLVSVYLDKFKWKSETLANCRCPICGDSQRNKNKARGFFYQKGNDFFFKCHNCGAGHSLFRFLEAVSPSLVKEYTMERWKNGENGNSNYRKPKEEDMFKLLSPPKFESKSDLLKPLLKASAAPKNHVVRQFLEMRKIPQKFFDILYYTDNFGSYMKLVDPDASFSNVVSEPRLVIPFFNKKNDVVAVQGRILTMKGEHMARETARYITLKADKSIERLWYGMWRANPKKRVYVVEGPLDSLFVPNTIAMVGASALEQVPSRFENSDMVYALDNEPRNKQIIAYMEKLINMDKKVCIWPETLTEKDINDMIYIMSVKEIKRMIDDNTYSGLQARLKFNEWRKA